MPLPWGERLGEPLCNSVQSAGAVTLDPRGFLGDSYFVDSLNTRVQAEFDNEACSSHIRHHLQHDSSKRPQLTRLDISRSILGRYVLIPTQKFSDLSVQKFSNITYPEMLRAAARFCEERSMPLVIKVHPHLDGAERDEQIALIRVLQQAHTDIFESKSSINLLASHALFTVTLNGGTLMDNFYTSTPVLTLARGFFHNTDVVRGMSRLLREELPWPQKRKFRQKHIVCWYNRMSLKSYNSPARNVAILQEHIDALRLPRSIVL